MGALRSIRQRPTPQQVLEQLLEDGRGDQLCGELMGITGASRALVEDAFQDVCLIAATPGRVRGSTEGELYAWLRHAAIRRIRDLAQYAHRRHELLVAWDEAQPPQRHNGAGADVEVLRLEKERELDRLAQLAVQHL
jgi:DNA-directed RNA polymerase specialized sigma24 family protein